MRISTIAPHIPRSLIRTLSSFSEPTQATLLEIFEGAMKICFFKYKRKIRFKQHNNKKKRIDISRIRLKRADISNAIALIDFHLINNKNIVVRDELLENFGIFNERDLRAAT